MRKIERLGLVLLEGSLGEVVRSCAGPYLRSEMRTAVRTTALLLLL
jgi:hypothetical protein